MSPTFYTRSGKPVIPGGEIGRGGEGAILEVQGEPSRCAKIYSGQGSETTLGKLSVMIANPPVDPTFGQRHRSIVWPEELLFRNAERTAFAGFLMPRVDNKVFRTALTYLSPDSRVKDLGGRFNWRYLYTAATNVASSVDALHEKGYCIGDLNESNLLIAPSALITIIDCDSFQVPDPATGKTYRCLAGKPEYTAPELQGRYGEIDRTLATDRFALGVLLFELLMEGTHPYQARGEAVEDLPSTRQKILNGIFPYAPGVRCASPPAFAPPFDMLDPSLRKLFLRCFEAGHGDPAARPSAQEWLDTLRNREYLLLTCPLNDNHVYFSHLRQCPWCERAQAMRRDSFPSSLGTQIALADPRAPLASVETRLARLHTLVALALADGVVTAQEREYLINRGLELQLTKAQVEKLLDGEIRKMGAKTSAAHAPKLAVKSRKLLLLPFRLSIMTGGAALGALFGMLLVFLATPRGLAQTAALLAVPCVAAACLQVNLKSGVAGLLWAVLLFLGIRFEVLPAPVASALTWAVLFASATWLTSPLAYRLRASVLLFPYPLLAACALQAVVTFGVAYFAFDQAKSPDLPKPAAPRVPARPAAPPVAEPFRVQVTGDSVNLRSQPEMDSDVVEQVPMGTTLEVEATFGAWFQVKRPQSPTETGWVRRDLVRRLEP